MYLHSVTISTLFFAIPSLENQNALAFLWARAAVYLSRLLVSSSVLAFTISAVLPKKQRKSQVQHITWHVKQRKQIEY